MERSTARIIDGDGEVLGVAFAVPVLDSTRDGTFLLSAGHTVWESYRRQAPMRLVSRTGEVIGEVAVLMCTAPDDASDVALLYVDGHELSRLTCILDVPATGTPVVVRGAPAGVGTLFANFHGLVCGEEMLGDLPVLDIVLEDLTVFDQPAELRDAADRTPISLPFRALRGLSGAPVVEADARGELRRVLGLVTRRNTRGIANRVMAVRLADVRSALLVAGHVLAGERSPTSLRDQTIEAWLGMSFMAAAASPELEHDLWEQLSGMFYAGHPVDDVLTEMAGDPRRYGITDDLTRCLLDHLCSRLLAKTGRSTEAAHFRDRVMAQRSLDGNEDYDRIAALTRLRRVVEDAEPGRPDEWMRRFEAAAGVVEDLGSLPDPNKAYELASATGRLALELLRGHVGAPCRTLPEPGLLPSVRTLTTRHGLFVQAYPSLLVEKQEIVQIGLAGLQTASALVAGEVEPDELMALCHRGRIAARQRRNAIFHAQMLLLEALTMWLTGRREQGLSLAIIVGSALRSASLSTDHEGVAQVHGVVRQASPTLGAVLTAVSRHGLGEGVARCTHPSDRPTATVASLRRAAQVASDRVAEVEGLPGLLDVESAELL